MSDRRHTIAVLVGNTALSSIIATTLAGKPVLRVREFETLKGLETYLRIAALDLVVTDFDNAEAPADDVSRRLRELPGSSRRPQIIALASQLGPRSKILAREAGIDEVIVKPMSPRYLLERVIARTSAARRPIDVSGFRQRDWTAFGDNIVPLFPAMRHI